LTRKKQPSLEQELSGRGGEHKKVDAPGEKAQKKGIRYKVRSAKTEEALQKKRKKNHLHFLGRKIHQKRGETTSVEFSGVQKFKPNKSSREGGGGLGEGGKLCNREKKKEKAVTARGQQKEAPSKKKGSKKKKKPLPSDPAPLNGFGEENQCIGSCGRFEKGEGAKNF